MNRLREERVIRRITQIKVALATGINPSKISLIENGYIQPRDDEKAKLSNALGVSPETIFPEAE